MKNMTRNSIFILFLATSQLFAIEQEPNIVGERKLSQEEKAYVKHQRQNTPDNIESSDQEPAVILPITASGEPRPSVDGQEVIKKSTESPAYVTTHSGAIHHPLIVSAFGDTVQLEDESVWLVRPADTMKTLNWLTSDTIIILSPGWFSAYQYAMYNADTGARINVDLIKQPRFNGLYTHWVVAIDFANARVCLEDGSIWSVLDKTYLDMWFINDLIIIGNNEGFFSGISPNILINVNINEYVRSKCIY